MVLRLSLHEDELLLAAHGLDLLGRALIDGDLAAFRLLEDSLLLLLIIFVIFFLFLVFLSISIKPRLDQI